MKERKEKSLPQDKDRHLDVPSEANRDKHINFLEIEDPENQNTGNRREDKETEERRKQWEQGIEEGKRERKSG
jgi:hypothetical protein